MPTLIAVTGPIGTGATTLVNSLTKVMPWQTLLEADVERTNPFFAQYHAHPTRYAFHNQVTFLTKSAESHKLLQDKQDRGVYIQDFTPFEHTEVYAYTQHVLGRLSTAEYQALVRLTNVLESLYVPPTLLVYRPLRRELLMQRVKDRGRSSEQMIDMNFLEAISYRFEEWIMTWTRSPILRIDEDLDVLAHPAVVKKLGSAITEHLDATTGVLSTATFSDVEGG